MKNATILQIELARMPEETGRSRHKPSLLPVREMLESTAQLLVSVMCFHQELQLMNIKKNKSQAKCRN